MGQAFPPGKLSKDDCSMNFSVYLKPTEGYQMYSIYLNTKLKTKLLTTWLVKSTRTIAYH